MQKFIARYSSHLFFIPWFVLIISSLFTISENYARSFVVIVILLLWLIIALKWKTSLELFLYTLFISSFNITITFPTLADCFVKGVYINYLCPTVHIIDIVVALNLCLFFSLELGKFLDKSSRAKEGISKGAVIVQIFKPFYIFLPLYVYSVIHIILHPDLITTISILRLNLYLSLIPVFSPLLKESIQKLLHVKKLKKESNKNFWVVFVPLLLILLLQLALGLFQFVKGRDLGLQLLGESNLLSGTINTSFMSNSLGLFLRSYGSFAHPNVLGGFALVIALLSYIFLFSSKKTYYFVLLFVSGFLILLTFSRTASVLYLILLVFSFYEVVKTKVKLFSIFPLFFDRFINLDLGETSVVDRINLLKASFDVFKNNWVVGVGDNHFVQYLEKFNITTSSGLSLLQPVHNIFILIIVEHGLIGGLFLICYLGYLKLKESISYVTDKNIFIYTVGIIILVGVLDHYFLTVPQGLFIFTLLLML